MIFSDYIGKVDTFDVACRKCDRRGKYSLAKLIEQHGPDKMIPWWLEEISADCPKRDLINRHDYYDLCGVHIGTGRLAQ